MYVLYFLFKGGFMKKYIISIFFMTIFCFGIMPGHEIYAMGSKKEKVEKETLPEGQSKYISGVEVGSLVEQKKVVLDEKNIEEIYMETVEAINNAGLRKYPLGYTGKEYEIFSGEILNVQFPQGGKYTVELIKSPYLSKVDLIFKKDDLFFRTVYQGEYLIDVIKDGSFYKRLTVNSKLKYSFTQEKNYDIILNSYEVGKPNLLINSVKLSRLAFPNALYHKKTAFMILEKTLEEKEFSEAEKALDFIDKNFQLDDMERKSIRYYQGEVFRGNPVKYKNFLLKHRDDSSMTKELIEVLLAGKSLSEEEALFLETTYEETLDSNIAKYLGNWYMNTDDTVKGERYLVYGKDYYNLCVLYLENSDMERFERCFENVSEEKKLEIIKLKDIYSRKKLLEKELNLGDEKYQAEDYEEAVLFYKRAEGKDMEIARRLGTDIKIAKSYYYILQYGEAAKYFEKALEMEKNPIKIAELQYLTGVCYYRLENREKSIESLEKLVNEYPGTSWANKAMIYIIKLR
jgi:tetratricopeptide (TPR) repeat protein